MDRVEGYVALFVGLACLIVGFGLGCVVASIHYGGRN